MKKIIIICSFLFFLIGCSIIQNYSKDKQIPTSGKVIINNSEYEMIVGNYRWNGEDTKIRRVNTSSPIDDAKDFQTISLEKNAKIEIVIENHPVLTVNQWNEDGEAIEIPLTDNQIVVPATSGHYIYEVIGRWIDGEASFIFDVEVE